MRRIKITRQVLHYYLFVLVIFTLIGLLLFYNVHTRNQDFIANQQRLMEASTLSASNEIALLVKELRRMVGIFAQQHQSLLEQVANSPDNNALLQQLNDLVRQYFPHYFTVTLANEQAELMLEDFEGFVGPVCQNDIKAFIKDAHKPHVYVHPNNEGYHFDIMSLWGADNKVLFISFKLEDITRLLKASELPDHQLFLVKQGVPDLIEVSNEGGRTTLSRDIKLSSDELARIGQTRAVEDTLWNIIDLPAAHLFSTQAQKIQQENLILLALFGGMLGLMLLLLLQENKKNQEAQAQLVQSSKMASLGQMVAGVAHEVNTPLGYVQSNVEMLGEQIQELQKQHNQCCNLQQSLTQKDLPQAQRQQKMKNFLALNRAMCDQNILDDALSLVTDSDYGLKRISELVQSLKDFSRMDRQLQDHFDLHQGLDSTLNIAHNVIKNKVEIIKNYGEIPLIRCAPSQINQVFLNLITNAAQAMEQEGTITLETGVKGSMVYVKVIDNGKGIQKKDLAHIFDPFFTTKAVGEGTGLGLSISYKIITDHQGKIEVASTVGQGTQFTVLLPLTPSGH